MPFFDQNPEQLRNTLRALDAQATRDLATEHEHLKQESKDFLAVMDAWSSYIRARHAFFFNPSEDAFNLVEVWIKTLNEEIRKINKETHTGEHFLSALTTVMKRENEMMRKINIARTNVR